MICACHGTCYPSRSTRWGLTQALRQDRGFPPAQNQLLSAALCGRKKTMKINSIFLGKEAIKIPLFEKLFLSVVVIFLSYGLVINSYSLFVTLFSEKEICPAIILGMNKGKHSRFIVSEISGRKHKFNPRDIEFEKYKIGDTIQITFSNLDPNEAYIGGNKHIITRKILGILLFSVISLVVYFKFRERVNDIYKNDDKTAA